MPALRRREAHSDEARLVAFCCAANKLNALFVELSSVALLAL